MDLLPATVGTMWMLCMVVSELWKRMAAPCWMAMTCGVNLQSFWSSRAGAMPGQARVFLRAALDVDEDVGNAAVIDGVGLAHVVGAEGAAGVHGHIDVDARGGGARELDDAR